MQSHSRCPPVPFPLVPSASQPARPAGAGRRRQRPRPGTEGVSRGVSAAVYRCRRVSVRVVANKGPGRGRRQAGASPPPVAVEAVPVPLGLLLGQPPLQGRGFGLSHSCNFPVFLVLVCSYSTHNARRIQAGENRAAGPSTVGVLTLSDVLS